MNNALKDCREALKLTLNQMAGRLNIDPSYVSHLESGDFHMTYRVAAEYSRVTRKARSFFESMIPPRKSKAKSNGKRGSK